MNENTLQTNGKSETFTRPGQTEYFTPRVDVVETDDALTLYADMPGVRPEDLDVRFDNGELTLHGRCAPRAKGGDWLVAEYGVGDFYRVFNINEQVDAGRITAELRQGVLTVRLPRSEAVKPRKITVQAS